MTTYQQERLDLVAQLNDCTDNVCSPCINQHKPDHDRDSSAYIERMCPDCPIYGEIREIGEALLQVTHKQKVEKGLRQERIMQPAGSVRLDKENFMHYAKQGFSNKEIAVMMGVHLSTINSWKKKWGFSREYRGRRPDR